MTKETLLEIAKRMPNTFHVDEIIECLIFWDDLEKAQRNLDEGLRIPQEELIKRMNDFMDKRRNERNHMLA